MVKITKGHLEQPDGLAGPCTCLTRAAFTLIELMIVVVILGLLATVVMPRILNRPEQARRMKAKIDIRNIESALALFKTDTGRFPTTSQGLEALVSDPGIKGYNADAYLDKLPTDPWFYFRRGPCGSCDCLNLFAGIAQAALCQH